jgi:hypothetical protein
MINHGEQYAHTRRAFLRTSTMGLGSMALASLLNEGRAQEANPLRPRPGHFPARAKALIFLFMAGGPCGTARRMNGRVEARRQDALEEGSQDSSYAGRFVIKQPTFVPGRATTMDEFVTRE